MAQRFCQKEIFASPNSKKKHARALIYRYLRLLFADLVVIGAQMRLKKHLKTQSRLRGLHSQRLEAHSWEDHSVRNPSARIFHRGRGGNIMMTLS
uniref:AlNc14C278G10077 protein n=1 Tax=Albugo laibachii Nc14 TaxID=890382 RepID=F0WUS9_9STRA|nr:AlNc14C278G10077 [Albugo laibachii Nc14]|eukprot:CCA25165.1 AlNc14C278G10077 [Albugo laibachii Nc14]